MDAAAPSTFCGGIPSFVRTAQAGTSTIRYLHGPIMLFTDVVVNVVPPNDLRAANVAKLFAGLMLGGQHGMEMANDFIGRSIEKRPEMLNQWMIDEVRSHYANGGRLTSSDLVRDLGDWARVWPNSKVTRATLERKGFLPKYHRARLVPSNGIALYADMYNPNDVPVVKTAMEKAFGSRFRSSV